MRATEIRVLLVDPDPIARRDLTAALRRHGDVRILSRCRTAKVGAVAIRAHQPDIVFLDAQLMAPHPSDTRPALVALAKPVTEGDVDDAIRCARAWIRSRRVHPTDRYPNRLAVCSEHGIMLVETAAIDWIQATDNCPLLHMGGRAEPVRDAMSDLERALDQSRFVRVSRSAIVNVDRIRAVHREPNRQYVLLLANGVSIVANRTRPGFVAPSLGV